LPKLTIDGRDVEVPEGATLLGAARALGIDVPTLCFVEGRAPSTSCMACLVKVGGKLVPSCATAARDGLAVESETDEVRDARRAAIELLLSDHAGDCIAPCQLTCPARMDIPLMTRLIAAGRMRKALVTIKETIAFPAVLGRVCPAPCEKACRRGRVDAPVSICLLKRRAADADLASGEPWLPDRKPATDKRVAVVGAGPAGLACAYALALEGHAVTVFDDRDAPGGELAKTIEDGRLPRNVLDAEAATIEKLGVEFRMGSRVGRDVAAIDLVRDWNAVVLACGEVTDALREALVKPLGLEETKAGVRVGKGSFATGKVGVFAAGGIVRRSRMAVRALAEGRAAAASAHAYVSGAEVVAPARPFTSRLGKASEAELAELAKGADAGARIEPSGSDGFSPDEATREAGRCLHCDCRKPIDCRLRRYADALGADAKRFAGERRALEVHDRHADVIYEPGKCISCGICVRIAEDAREELGLTFIGRGFTVKVGVPFGGTVAEGLARTARECASACPTGALALKDSAGEEGRRAD
jgi:NADPH-dependent 2,4-dienoyl-CoA reductase/sulfur reductase-like enzyme